MKLEIPDISVYCLTYNHERYISDTIEGILDQKTDLRIEICVFDDVSTDKTIEIIQEYQAKYPNTITIYQPPYNLNESKERSLYERYFEKQYLKGKYIAFCEGDDYWCDTNKLQMQYDFMEQHPECVMCAHAAIFLDCRTGIEREFHPFNKDGYLTPAELILKPNGNLPTSASFYRKLMSPVDEKYPSCDVGDVPFQLYALTKGRIWYHDIPMSYYRYHHPGSWGTVQEESISKRIKHRIAFAVFLEEYEQYTKGIFHESIKALWEQYLYSALKEVLAFDDESSLYELKEINSDSRYILKLRELIKRKYAYKADPVCFDKDEIKIIRKAEKIVIFGAGHYSAYIEEILKKLNAKWDGYLLSELADNNHKKSLPVWKISTYPYAWDSSLVIMGIGQNYEDEILNGEGFSKIKNLLSPLWFAKPLCFSEFNEIQNPDAVT